MTNQIQNGWSSDRVGRGRGAADDIRSKFERALRAGGENGAPGKNTGPSESSDRMSALRISKGGGESDRSDRAHGGGSGGGRAQGGGGSGSGGGRVQGGGGSGSGGGRVDKGNHGHHYARGGGSS